MAADVESLICSLHGYFPTLEFKQAAGDILFITSKCHSWYIDPQEDTVVLMHQGDSRWGKGDGWHVQGSFNSHYEACDHIVAHDQYVISGLHF